MTPRADSTTQKLMRATRFGGVAVVGEHVELGEVDFVAGAGGVVVGGGDQA